MSANVRFERLLAHGLLDVCHRAEAQAFVLLVAAGEDVHGDVPRLWMRLQVLEDAQPVELRELEIEEDRARQEPPREGEPRVAAERDDPLEPVVARHAEERRGEGRRRPRR